VPEDLMIYYSVALYERVGEGQRLWQKKMLFKRDIVRKGGIFRKKRSWCLGWRIRGRRRWWRRWSLGRWCRGIKLTAV
jgi:hypothetical protein